MTKPNTKSDELMLWDYEREHFPSEKDIQIAVKISKHRIATGKISRKVQHQLEVEIAVLQNWLSSGERESFLDPERLERPYAFSVMQTIHALYWQRQLCPVKWAPAHIVALARLEAFQYGLARADAAVRSEFLAL